MKTKQELENQNTEEKLIPSVEDRELDLDELDAIAGGQGNFGNITIRK